MIAADDSHCRQNLLSSAFHVVLTELVIFLQITFVTLGSEKNKKVYPLNKTILLFKYIVIF